MRCFNHADADAVAACKHCTKALCHECVVVAPGGCSCRGACEEEVAFVYAMLDRSKNALGGSVTLVGGTGWFLVISGTAMAAWGIYADFSSFPLLMGIVFIVCGIIGMRLRKPFTPPEKPSGDA